MEWGTGWKILKRAMDNFMKDDGFQMGAALAYYALFSIAPLLLAVVFVAGAVYGEKVAETSMQRELQEAMGPEIADSLVEMMQKTHQAQEGVTPLLALGLFFFGAITVFLHVRSSLIKIWHLPPPSRNTYMQMVWNYSLAIVMVLLIGVLLLASITASSLLANPPRFLQDLPWIGLVGQVVEFLLSFVFSTLMFALIYRILSGRQITWFYALLGALTAAFLFTIGKTLFGLYFAYVDIGSTYGGAGSLVMFLIWIYYSSQMLIFGAELVEARRTRREWLK